LLVFLIAALQQGQGGAFFYFIATSIIGLVLLNPVDRRLGLLSVLLSVSLAAIAYFGDGFPAESIDGDQNYQTVKFVANFTMGLVSCVLVVLFVMKRNRDSESILREKQQEMTALTDELEKSKNRYALALEGSGAGIYEWDIANDKVFVSTKYKELMGYHPEEELIVTSQSLIESVHPDDKEKSSKNIIDAIQFGKAYQNEFRLKRKDGKYRWFLDSGIISMKDGVAIQAVGSLIDIDDRKMAETLLRDKNSELEKTNEELDRFVYSASHDMRAPLSTLLGLLNLAKSTTKKAELEEYHKLMANRVKTMEGFIREVTDYSRNARLAVEPVNVNLLSLIEKIRESYQFLTDESGVEFQIDVSSELNIVVDKSRLNVVLNNLVSNAIKYHDPMKTNPHVRIMGVVENGFLVLKVEDNGVGIPEEYHEKIFDMFFRASEKSDGSGLGLYIVHETISRLGGNILCKSDYGLGSTFEVRIAC
jgi:PAS domain S-box-containing protein